MEASLITRNLSISFFSNAKDNQVKSKTLSIPECIQALTDDPELVDVPDDASEDEVKKIKERAELVFPGTYKGQTRAKDEVKSLEMLFLDFDGENGKGLTPHEVQLLFAWLETTEYLHVSYNSFSSGFVAPNEKLRVVLFFERAVTADEFEATWNRLTKELPVKPDPSCKQFWRCYFTPYIARQHADLYQSSTDGFRLLTPSSSFGAKLNAAGKARDWEAELRTCEAKYETLIAASFYWGLEAAKEGKENADAVWPRVRAALDQNRVSAPVRSWSAAEKAARNCARDGFKRGLEEREAQKTAQEGFTATPTMVSQASAALKKEVKLVEQDFAQLGNAAFRLGRYCPHVLREELVKKELFKAATQSSSGGVDGFLTETEARVSIDAGVARGQKNPLFVYVGWKKKLVLDQEKGTPVICDENAALYFGEHPDVAGLVRYNVRKGKPSLEFPPPWETPRTEFPCSIEDHDAVDAGRWLAKQMGKPMAGAERTLKALNTVAMQHQFDPFRDWLEGLKWDGVPRLSEWVTRTCGVADTAYHRAVAAKFVLSAVARTFTPGCDAQHVLVLVGAQGLGKSKAFRVLAGPEYFCSNIGDIHKDEAVFNLSKYVIVELAELAAFKKAEMEIIKRFISDSSEDLRRKYAHNSEAVLRRAVFGGTTNVKEFLVDPTGNRRFWPVLCERLLDVVWLEENREQLWAEAVDRYRKGEPWWPTPEEESLFNLERETYVDEDDLTERAEFFLRPFVRWPTGLESECKIIPDQLEGDLFRWATLEQIHYIMGTDITNRADQLRVAKIFRGMGYEKRSTKVSGRKYKIVDFHKKV